ncbi:mannose/cellobiose epimerase-like protein (N-acyl-D-glucosamine 2-epimerase family) [Haloactinopolyspora alba]|uniref:Mannose/cellobiose epimerase-like protein (N-acyl-D-glucosamine 2-epimerase family) n=1 Tax=Haloactinopolyspora alba TaxID=648780 RepID=A0A2P8DTA3_9ACTN|nr:AGE family epimerase/isomerase [Haloactinopolyspora alba]PSL00447.1 mannose/cellobiose epimerase-like protein (N-acyl-D-glucosamine 2-epimerase family) [Haloactinopolyspora alba]
MNATTYEIGQPAHDRWLAAEAERLLDFYQDATPDRSGGGFWWLDGSGRPQPQYGKQLWINARMVHAFAIGALAGRPGCQDLVSHGLDYLNDGPLHDVTHGGWMWAADATGEVVDSTKQAYGHAFVLLAASSGFAAGAHASSMIDEVTTVIDERYWRATDGLCVDTYTRTWSDLERYRGQNANMHLVEAFLTAGEVTGARAFVQRATRIAERIIDELTRTNGWRLAEHYDESWQILRDYNHDDPDHKFRPYGSIIGHWLEWARLLVQLHAVTDSDGDWMLTAARNLFDRAVHDGWDAEHTGFVYVVDWDGTPLNRHRYHWVIAEAIGAASVLYRATSDAKYQRWNSAFWEHADRWHIDREAGGWHHELTADNCPTEQVWDGKPDLYHALQATYFARIPLDQSIAAALANGRVSFGDSS